MINTSFNHEYCMECGTEIKDERDECICGSKNFIFGNHFTFEKKKAVCGCGSDDFKKTFRMNCNPRYTTNYVCTKCSNKIGTEVYYESQYY